MTDDLRTRMHRVADDVTPLPVSDNLWRRGQTARHRGQALVVAAVLVALASVGGGVALWSAPDREVRTASTEVPEGGAIPSRIEDIPDDLASTSDLALGRSSAAFVSSSGDVVVITAKDGVPHRLALPGWVADQRTVALSPDGRRLAWHQRADDTSATIAVLDLVSGRTSSFPVAPDPYLRLRELSWSPDSSWIAWIGDGGAGSSIGRLQPRADPRSTSMATSSNIPDIAVSNEGALVLSRPSGALFRTDGRTSLQRIAGPGVGGAGRFSPDGRLLALRSSPDPSSYTLDTMSGEVLEHPFPEDTFEDGFVLPQGWLDDRLQLLLVQDPGSLDHAEMVVTTPQVDASSTWRRSVGVVETGPAVTLSLAVDLVPDLDGTSSQALTHDFGDTTDVPPAPLGIELSLFIGLAVAAAIALLLGLRWLWRRLS
jgi:roadblock/LC7 domain-containing protein